MPSARLFVIDNCLAANLLMALNTESVDHQWGQTELKFTKCIYTWTLENFSLSFAKTGIKVSSPIFAIKGHDKVTWCIDLYPMGKHQDDKEFISLYLRLVSTDEHRSVRARVNLSLINSRQEEITLVSSSPQTILFNTSKTTPSTCCEDYGKNRCMSARYVLNQKDILIPEDRLTIRCKIEVISEIKYTNGRGDKCQFEIQKRCLSNDICKLLEDTTLSDVTLVAGRKEIRAHKLILAARSKVFAAMFVHEMQEQKFSRVEITDVDHDTLTEMLHFMYTDRAPNLDKMAADLLVAADKYDLDKLKAMCEEALCKSLSAETATDTLILADLHSATVLKEHTIAFITSNHANVMATEGWKKMTNPHLVAELFRVAASTLWSKPSGAGRERVIRLKRLEDSLLL